MRIYLVIILFCTTSAAIAQDKNLTFKVRKVQYDFIGDNVPVDNLGDETDHVSVMDLVSLIPAQLENRYVAGRNSRIVFCRIILTKANGEVERLAMTNPPVLDLLTKFVGLEAGATVEVDQLQVIDSNETLHWVPGLVFSSVDLNGLARVQSKLKKITG